MSKSDSIVARSRVMELLDYNPETGVFKWRVTRRGRAVAGSVAGTVATNGYLNISIDDRLYKAHRLAWVYVHGDWPKQLIDHINGEKLDNRIVNLRDVSSMVNQQNQRRACVGNRSGLLGVTLAHGKWVANIWVAGRSMYIGSFADKHQAYDAYVAAKRELHEGCTL